MRSLTFLVFGSFLALGCAGRAELPGTTTASATIEAAISAATLGNDCGARESSFAGDCAPSSDDTGVARPCGGGCQQSNMQLSITNSGKAKVAIAVAEVHLLDAATSARLDDVDAKNARIWDGTKYVAWDAFIAPSTTAKVSYDMTQIDWTKIGGGNPWNTYSRRYKIEVVLRVDGADRTLLSSELSREAEVVTQSHARWVSAG